MDRRSVQLYDLSGHPEYAACVGEIVAVWSKIELRLSLLFSFLLRAPPWTAWAAWFSLFNSKARQDMMRALVAELQAELPEKAEPISIINRVAKAPTARHGYAHKPWLLVGEKVYQLDLPAMPLEASRKHHISLNMLQRDRDALRKLEADLNEFVQRFGNTYPMLLDWHLTRQSAPWPGRFTARPER